MCLLRSSINKLKIFRYYCCTVFHLFGYCCLLSICLFVYFLEEVIRIVVISSLRCVWCELECFMSLWWCHEEGPKRACVFSFWDSLTASWVSGVYLTARASLLWWLLYFFLQFVFWIIIYLLLLSLCILFIYSFTLI